MHPAIRTAYGYPNYVIYISGPVILLSTLTFLGPLAERSRPTLLHTVVKWIGAFHLVLTAGLYIFFNRESNRLPVVVENVSNQTVSNIRLYARNDETYRQEKLEPGQQFVFMCQCRDVTFPDETGIKLTYQLNNRNIDVRLVGVHSPFNQDSLITKIINDTLSYTNYEQTRTWVRNGAAEPVQDRAYLEELIKKNRARIN